MKSLVEGTISGRGKVVSTEVKRYGWRMNGIGFAKVLCLFLWLLREEILQFVATA
jgi:hypothetical protein